MGGMGVGPERVRVKAHRGVGLRGIQAREWTPWRAGAHVRSFECLYSPKRPKRVPIDVDQSISIRMNMMSIGIRQRTRSSSWRRACSTTPS
jgi:hypothetical protein